MTKNITFNIENNTPDVKQYNLLGASFNGEDISSPGLTVKVPQSSTKQVQRDNQSSVFVITAMKVKVSNLEQLDETINIVSKEMTGAATSNPITPSDYQNPANEQAKLIVMNQQTGFQPIKVWGNVGLQGNLLPKSNMTVTATIEYRFQPGNYLGKAGQLVRKLLFWLPNQDIVVNEGQGN